ncbi:hypothetical protein V8F06_001831 [Rhypophila decipiens]
MRFSLPSILSLLLLGGSNISSVLAEAQDPVEATGVITIGKPLPTLPLTCLLQKPQCFTHTTTVTSRCPNREIADKDCPTAPIACPAVIKITTTQVPCKTNCCPVTPTKTVTAPCLGCITRCVIPTHTETVTTGCDVKPTLVPIPTLTTRTIGIPLPTKTLM